MSKFNWPQTRAKLKPLYEEAGIMRCELELPGCTFGFSPSFAHSKKVREWESQEDAEEVIVACVTCHNFIEALGKKKVITMYEVVTKIRENRRVKP